MFLWFVWHIISQHECHAAESRHSQQTSRTRHVVGLAAVHSDGSVRFSSYHHHQLHHHQQPIWGRAQWQQQWWTPHSLAGPQVQSSWRGAHHHSCLASGWAQQNRQVFVWSPFSLSSEINTRDNSLHWFSWVLSFLKLGVVCYIVLWCVQHVCNKLLLLLQQVASLW